VFIANAQAQDTKIGFVSTERIFREANPAKVANTKIEQEFCAPKILLPPGTVRGQTEPCLTVTDPGYPIIVNQDLPADLVYRLAKALNESSPAHWASEDIFYSTRHAPYAYAPLHPGAAKYYRELGVLE